MGVPTNRHEAQRTKHNGRKDSKAAVATDAARSTHDRVAVAGRHALATTPRVWRHTAKTGQVGLTCPVFHCALWNETAHRFLRKQSATAPPSPDVWLETSHQ